MVVAIFTVLLAGFMLGGSTVYLVENHFRTKEMNKIYKLTESLINGNDLDDSDIGKETLYSKTTNQLIRLQEMLEGRRKEAEKSRYEIQKLISEIAHQLRTPLSNIKNYTELLQESLDETQEVLNTEYMKDLRTSEEQLCFLVESFIKTARLEQGIIQVHTQKENLVETILNALGQIQKKAEDKDIFFQVELPEKLEAFSGLSRVVVTAREALAEEAQRLGIHIVENRQPEQGISHSVSLALQELLSQNPDLEGVLFLVCDQPGIQAATIQKILNEGCLHKNSIVCAGYDGMRGNPVLWGSTYFQELMHLTGDTGGRQLMKQYEEKIRIVECAPEELKDIDRREDMTE